MHVTWLVPALALLLGAGDPAPPDPASLADRVLALCATGDPARLARARELVPDPLRADPAYRAAAAARALAGLLAAADLRESAPRSPDGEARLSAARARREEALEELRPLVREAPDDPDVLRALAVYYGLDARPEEVARLADRMRAAGAEDDPWLDFAATAAATRGRPASDAEPRLLAFIRARPGILPPRISLVRSRLARGDGDGAMAALDALLDADPDHDAGRELKASLLAPPPVERLSPVVPAGAPPPGAPGWLPRKRPGGNARSG